MRPTDCFHQVMNGANDEYLMFPHSVILDGDLHLGSGIIKDLSLDYPGSPTLVVVEIHNAIAEDTFKTIRSTSYGSPVATRGITGSLTYNAGIPSASPTSAGLGPWSLLKRIVAASVSDRFLRLLDLNLTCPNGMAVYVNVEPAAAVSVNITYHPWTSGYQRAKQAAGTYAPESSL